MFSALLLFIALAFFLQPCSFQEDTEVDICAVGNGIEESAFSLKVESAKIKADGIKLMHASSLMKILHNGTEYMSYQFSSRFTHEASTYLLSHYTFYDHHFTTILCAFYGGHLLEITKPEIFNEIKRFVSESSTVECIFLGSVQQGVGGDWIHEFSGLPAKEIFTDEYPTAEKAHRFAKMVKSAEGEWSVQNGPLFAKNPCTMICQVPK